MSTGQEKGEWKYPSCAWTPHSTSVPLHRWAPHLVSVPPTAEGMSFWKPGPVSLHNPTQSYRQIPVPCSELLYILMSNSEHLSSTLRSCWPGTSGSLERGFGKSWVRQLHLTTGSFVGTIECSPFGELNPQSCHGLLEQ